MPATTLRRRLVARVILLVLFSGISTATVGGAQIVFDLPPAVACHDVTPPDFQVAHPSLKVIEGTLRISARVVKGAEAEIVDFLYVIDNRSKSMRFQDYLPNTTLESAVADDQVEITDASENAKITGLDARVVYKPFSLGGTHNQSRKTSESSHYRKIAQRELVLAAGTTNREHGVFFRLRPSRAASLEGAKEFTFLAAVPVSWRGDLCTISCIARTEKSSLFSSSVKPAGEAHAMVPVHLVGDAEAAELVREFRRVQEARSAALRAHETDSVFDVISSRTVGLLTSKKCETKSAKAVAEAEAAVAQAQERLTRLAE